MRLLVPFILVGLSLACAPQDYDINPDGTDNDAPIDTATDPEVDGEPVAVAGDGREVHPLETIVINGMGSYDPAGLAITDYRWDLVSKPSGSTAILNDMGSAATKSFFADLAGDYTFSLTVMNEAGVWDSTPDTVTFTAVPGDGFYVQVSWDTATDQDLHLLRTGAQLWDNPGDCAFCNMTPSWGSSSSVDDPSLDWDTIPGFGPETTTIESPAAGTYNVQVHFYGQDGGTSCVGSCPRTNITVDVYIGGVHAQTFTGVMQDAGQVWNVATIDWPSQAITVNNSYDYTFESSCGW